MGLLVYLRAWKVFALQFFLWAEEEGDDEGMLEICKHADQAPCGVAVFIPGIAGSTAAGDIHP